MLHFTKSNILWANWLVIITKTLKFIASRWHSFTILFLFHKIMQNIIRSTKFIPFNFNFNDIKICKNLYAWKFYAFSIIKYWQRSTYNYGIWYLDGCLFIVNDASPFTTRTAIWWFGLITNRSICQMMVLNFPYASYCPMHLSKRPYEFGNKVIWDLCTQLCACCIICKN